MLLVNPQLRVILTIVMVSAIFCKSAFATDEILENWRIWKDTFVSNSQTLQNLESVTVPGVGNARCLLCHNTTSGGAVVNPPDVNAYGFAINRAVGLPFQRIDAVKNDPSVSSTGSFSFLEEIAASAQPAWSTVFKPNEIADILLDPPTPRTLTVASSNPGSGVGITVSPADNNGQGSDTTQFTRTYNNNATVTLTAPATAGGNNFSGWSGCNSTSGVTCSVTLNTNKTVTAVYATPTRTLTVASSNPGSGVGITVSPADNNGQGSDTTQFTRTYNINAAVTLTAAATAGGNNFSGWSGCNSTSGVTCSVTLNTNKTVTAVYATPTRTLTVASSNPGSGVGITVSPADNNGQGSDTTQFTRTYNINAAVTLTAAATAGGNNFSGWSGCNSISGVGGRTCSVTLNTNKTVTAVYVTPIRTLTVASINPGSGVGITVSPADNNGQGSGATQFTRTYNNNATVTLTAAATAGGDDFSSWSGCNSISGVGGRTCNVTMNANKTVTAVYGVLISINDVSLTEGSPIKCVPTVSQPCLLFPRGVSFVVTLSRSSIQTVMVTYSTANGTATAPSDYSAQSGTLIFNPGETEKPIVVVLNRDATPESNETFVVNLTSATNAAIAKGQGIGIIVNDDSVLKGITPPVDFDGDGRADIAVYRDGAWFIIRSSDGGVTAVGWGGLPQDKPVPGDYDGDSKTDLAVYRDGAWYIIRSSDGGVTFVEWGGLPEDRPVPADYDGDGRTDIAVYRDGEWYIIRSSDGGVTFAEWGGLPEDRPVPADYDGDGRTDIAVYRDGEWYIIRSSDGGLTFAEWGGLPQDIPVPADYDGDGRDDIAVYRHGALSTTQALWFIVKSSDGTGTAIQWGGLPQDIPVPGDYDGDGETDVAVYRDGDWFVMRSSDGGVANVGWGGLPEDIPLNSP